jgi:hypothetical protein
MPPKTKADVKKKQAVVEDRTFGLKNKKGHAQQKFIEQLHSSSGMRQV